MHGQVFVMYDTWKYLNLIPLLAAKEMLETKIWLNAGRCDTECKHVTGPTEKSAQMLAAFVENYNSSCLLWLRVKS